MKFAGIMSLAVTVVTACSTDKAKTADTTGAAVDTGAATVAAEPGPAAPASASGMLDPNTASAAELAGVPGVTPELAAAIEAGRPHATMLTVDRILAPKLDEKQRDSVYTRIWIPIDLNKATGAEILLIPGVGAKMRHEFEEYRPWKSLEQFRREIGKYVDEAEVARLERYVSIR